WAAKALTEFWKNLWLSVRTGPSRDLRLEPALGVGPVVVGGRDGNAERLRRLVPGQSGEEPQLDQFRRAGGFSFQLVKRFDESEQVKVGPVKLGRHIGQFNADVSAAGFGPPLASGDLDQDSAHRLRGRGKEVSATFPLLGPAHIHQAQERLVHQSR